MSVDLPAPFSPHERVDGARPDGEVHVLEGGHARERLGHAAHGQQRPPSAAVGATPGASGLGGLVMGASGRPRPRDAPADARVAMRCDLQVVRPDRDVGHPDVLAVDGVARVLGGRRAVTRASTQARLNVAVPWLTASLRTVP